MHVDDHPVEVILKESRRFMVPLYQRKYQWDDQRLLPFWEDVEAKASEVLEEQGKFQHYMGALILSPIGPDAQIGVTPKVQVVDGQQRLTTFLLFLVALREVAREYKQIPLIEHVGDYLFNQPKSKDNDPLTRFKLTPTPSDQDVFHDIIEMDYEFIRRKYAHFYWGGRVPKNTPFRALRAYEIFRQKIEYFVSYGPTYTDEEEEAISDETDTEDAIELRLEALLGALLTRMKLVVIILDEDDDAQVIFETLNSKGQPLLAMDLVRNNIFHRAEKEGDSIDELYTELWDPFDDPWWREPAPFARPRRPRIDHFLAHTLIAETGDRISMRELYAEYRAFVLPKGRPRFDTVRGELQMLQYYAPLYKTLEGQSTDDETLAWLGSKFSSWQITTAYPVAMQLSNEVVSNEEREQVSRLIYSYIVRRALSGLTSKNLNKVFQSLAQLFVQGSPSVCTVKDYFSTGTSDSIRFPSDQEFRQGILYQPVYYLMQSSKLRDVLWELELASRPQFAERTVMPEDLWIEHVLPISWTEDWPFEDDSFIPKGANDPKADTRDQLIHTLGNLTLLTSGLDISVGNKDFTEKKSRFNEHSSLFLNKWFSKKSKWTEVDIQERGKHLADLAVHIWPGL